LDRSTAARLFLAAVFIYNANGTHSFAVDSNSTRLLPYSLLKEADFDLDEFTFLYGAGIPPYVVRTEGHFVSSYPPGPAIMALPFYIPPFLASVSAQSTLMLQVEKVAASVFVALSVVLVYSCVATIADAATALLFALIYAFGTSSLSISSQGLWQHGPSQLLVATSLYLLVRGREREKAVGLAGLSLGAAVLCRPTDILVALPLAAYVLHRHPQKWFSFVSWALPSVLFLVVYNLWYFGSIARMPYDQGFFSGNGWATPFMEGLPGVLVSPSRGIFIYSPVFVFALWGIYLSWRSRGNVLFRYLSISVILSILFYSKWKIWWGGWAFGPRLLADITPLLVLLMLPAYARIRDRPLLTNLFFLAGAAAIFIHTLGAYSAAVWDPELEGRLWSWSDGELINSVRRLFSKIF
jgi:hypothetical protein